VTSKEPKHFVVPLLGGELKPVVFSFPEKYHLAILSHLSKDIEDETVKEFLTAVETELGKFSLLKSFSNQSSGETLKDLAKLNKNASRLLEAFENLHPQAKNTLNLSAAFVGSPSIDLFVVQLHSINNSLEITLSSLTPNQSGRPKNYLRQQLIEKIALHYKNCLGKFPKSTKDGPFENILRICLESINIRISDLHSQILEALRTIKV